MGFAIRWAMQMYFNKTWWSQYEASYPIIYA